MGGIEIIGVKEIEDALKNMPIKLEKKYLRDAIKNAAAPLMAELKARAPRAAVHNPVRSFHTFRTVGTKAKQVAVPEPLADSLYITSGTRKGRPYVSIVGNFYARFLEFGTRFMGKRAFIRPVMDGVGDNILQQVLDRLKTQIENESFK